MWPSMKSLRRKIAQRRVYVPPDHVNKLTGLIHVPLFINLDHMLQMWVSVVVNAELKVDYTYTDDIKHIIMHCLVH